MGESGFLSKEGEEGVAEEGPAEVCEPGPAGLCCCGDEGVSEAAVEAPTLGPEHAQADLNA